MTKLYGSRWLVIGLFLFPFYFGVFMDQHEVLLGTTEWLRQLPLVSTGGQSQYRIWFTLPAHRASHIIKSAMISIGVE